MSRSSALANFNPSFMLAGLAPLRALFKTVFDEVRNAPDLSARPSNVIKGAKDNFTSDPVKFLRFGDKISVSQAGSGLDSFLPYTVEMDFDSNDEISLFRITLHLLNVRLPLSSVSNPTLIPADYKPATEKIAAIPVMANGYGIALRQDPGVTTNRDVIMLGGLDPSHLGTREQKLKSNPPDSRVDLIMSWEPLVSGNSQLAQWARMETALGLPVCRPDAKIPPGVAVSKAEFYATGYADFFNALLHQSDSFALTFGDTGGAQYIGSSLKDLKDEKTQKENDGENVPAALSEKIKILEDLAPEFGLTEDFRGVVVDGLGIKWLEEKKNGELVSQPTASVQVQRMAVATGGKVQDHNEDTAKWYVTAEAMLESPGGGTVFGLFEKTVTARVSVESEALRYASLTGTFSNSLSQKPALEWLLGKNLMLSVIRYNYTNANGEEKKDWAQEIALTEGGAERVIGRLRPDANASHPNDLDRLSSAMIFGPFLTKSGNTVTENTVDPNSSLPAPDPRSRGHFVDLDGFAAGAATGVLASNAMKEAYKTKEIRFTGLYGRRQPRAINNPSESGNELALLVDFETDFDLDFVGKVETAAPQTARIEGFGPVLSDDLSDLRWVRLANGIFELPIADPGLWKLDGPLGKILKVVAVNLRSFNPVELEIRLGLSGNFGVVQADEFVLRINLADEDAQLMVLPTGVKIDLPGVLKGAGKLDIKELPGGQQDIIGSLDLSLIPAGLRIAAALRLTWAEAPDKRMVRALLASAKVEFPKPSIPVSALRISALDALFGMNFKRNEPTQISPAIPPALQWLQNAGGDVSGSVDDGNLWTPQYGSWVVGIGADVELQASSRLINLNGMIVFEQPGPVFTLFSKVSIMKTPKKTGEMAAASNDAFTGGILGLMQYDNAQKAFTLAALADLEFNKLTRLHVPLELYVKGGAEPDWHFYLGHPLNPVIVTFDLGDALNFDANFYFITAGGVLKPVPVPGGPVIPGFGLAMGFGANLQIGKGRVSLSASARLDVALSFANPLFAAGAISLSGELNIAFLSIGASAQLQFLYNRDRPKNIAEAWLKGEVCGKIKAGLFTLEGCAGLEIGTKPANTQALPDLVLGLTGMLRHQSPVLGAAAGSMAEVALPVIKDTPLITDLPESERLPLDSALALELSAPPVLASDTGSVRATDIGPASDRTTFNIGGQSARYKINNLTLKNEDSSQEIKLPAEAVGWWRAAADSAGGQPSPLSLAMLTGSPLPGAGQMTDPDAISGAIDAALGDPCATHEARAGLHSVLTTHLQKPLGPVWQCPGTACVQPGESGLLDHQLAISVSRANVDSTLDAAIPSAEATPAPNPAGEPALVLRALPGSETGISETTVRFETGGISDNLERPLWLLMALSGRPTDLLQNRTLTMQVVGADGQTEPVNYRAVDLIKDAKLVHENCPVWQRRLDGFLATVSDTRWNLLEPVALQPDFSRVRMAIQDIEAVELIRSGNDAVPVHATELCYGAIYTSAREEARAADAQDMASRMKNKLGSPASTDLLLEPDTIYSLSCEVNTNNNNTPVESKKFWFQTAKHPPRSVDPWLITTLPSDRRTRHYFEDPFGMLLESDTILKVLAKFGARLKVRVTHDGRLPVTGSRSGTVALDWSSTGVILDPADLVAAGSHVTGASSKGVAGLPDLLNDVLRERAANGDFPCLPIGPTSPPTARWIAFDVPLEPNTGYRMRIDLVDANGDDWRWLTDSSAPSTEDQPFFDLSFRTSRHKNAEDHAGRLINSGQRDIMLVSAPSVPVSTETNFGIEILPDKQFEDLIATLTGQRLRRDELPGRIRLWQSQVPSASVAGVLLMDQEPLMRSVSMPHREEITTNDGKRRWITEHHPLDLSHPDLTGTGTGASRALMPASGDALLILTDSTAPLSGIKVPLSQFYPGQVTGDQSPTSSSLLIDMPGSDFDTRPLL